MSQDFPRVYRKSRGGRIFALVFGSFVAALCVGGLGLFAAEIDGSAGRVLTGFWLGMLLGTVYLVVAAFRVRVVLHADAIENHGVFSIRRMQRDEIRGYRLLEPLDADSPGVYAAPVRAN